MEVDAELIAKSRDLLTSYGILDEVDMFKGHTIIELGGEVVYTPLTLKQKSHQITTWWNEFSEHFKSMYFEEFYQHQDVTFGQWNNFKSAIVKAKKWIDSGATGVFSITASETNLTSGTGKTALAIATMLDLLEKGYGCVYWRVPTIAQAWFQDGTNFPDGVQKKLLSISNNIKESMNYIATNAPILILDDFGLHYQSEFVDSFLNAIITSRADSPSKGTIVVSQKSLTDLARNYPVIASRMSSNGVIINPTAKPFDYRTA